MLKGLAENGNRTKNKDAIREKLRAQIRQRIQKSNDEVKENEIPLNHKKSAKQRPGRESSSYLQDGRVNLSFLIFLMSYYI